MNSKVLVKLLAGLLCYCYFFNPVLAQQTAPDDPNDMVTGESYITDNLVEDPLSWSGPQSQGDCTYRPNGHGTWGNDSAHWQGDWYSNPAYRSCPQISSAGVMRFGWRPEEDMGLVNNIDAEHPIIAPYAEALAEAGIIVSGYNYAWSIKNYDANDINNRFSQGPYDKEGYGYSQDLLSITVEFIGQENQDVVWSKEYEYNYRIANWRRFSGSEEFDLNGTDFEKIRITVDGYDAGYWAGYFGPEVMNVQFQLIFTVVETDTCDEDPLSSPTCYGYQDAFNKSIGLPTQAEMLAELESEYGATDTTSQSEVTSFFDGGTPDGTSFEYNEEIEAAIEAEIQVFEQEQLQAFEQEQAAQQTGATIDDGQSTGISQEESTGISQEESTGVSQEESTGVADPVEEAAEAVEEAAAEATAEAIEKPASNVNALSVAQNAEAAGNAVAGSAVNLATGAAITSLNNDIATSTSLNQQSQQQSVQASNTGVAINGSSNNSNSMSSNSSGFSNGSFDGSGDSSTSLSDSIASVNSNVSSFDSQFDIEAASENGQSIFAAEFELASLDQNILDDAINSVINTMLLMQNAAEDNFKEDTSDEGQLTAEEEDALVAAAQSGDDSEEAQAALLGYNPNFRAYQQPQMAGGEIYSDQGVYENQKTYDSPSAGLFNSASDATHREMVRQQYELGN
jgi:hypothetical protein